MLFKIHVPKKDAAEFRLDGFLYVDLHGTSVGVYQYTRPDGQIVNEYKSVDEVARPESLQTILGVPLTVHHPYEFANPDNFRAMTIGAFVMPGTMDGRRVKTRAVIYDAKTIERVLNGELTEISMGYYHTPESVNGSFEGIEYQVLQTWIYYNHGSLYEPGGGRLGSDVGVSMDTGSKDKAGHVQQFVMHYPAAAQVLQNQDSIREVKTMLININGESLDVPDAVGAKIKTALDSKDSQINTLTKDLAQTKEDSATIEARLTVLEKVNEQDAAQQQQDKIDAAVAERQEIMDSARAVLPANYEFKGKSNAQIMTDSLDVLEVPLPESAKGVEPAIRASFDTAIKFAVKPSQGTDSKTPAQRVTQTIAQDSKAINAGKSYVPLAKRTDGIADHSSNLESMNKFFNKKGAKV